MASFPTDIFISYAHADNSDGWVDAFQTSLENRLRIYGRAPQIWRDPKIGGATVFADEISDRLKQSALLISILSPNGLASTWCERERRQFERYAEANGGFRLGNFVRALKVVMTPAEHDAHRPVFDTIGYEFFEQDRKTGLKDHFLPSEERFIRKVDHLAQEADQILALLAAAARQPLRPVIYVAEVTPDLAMERAKICDQIKAWGYRVTPLSPLPMQSPDVHSAVDAALAEAALTVHLISDKRGAIPGEEDRSILAVQYQRAQMRHIDCIVWIRPGTQPHSSIEKVLQTHPQPERLEGQSIEKLKETIAERLNSLSRPASAISRLAKLIYAYAIPRTATKPSS